MFKQYVIPWVGCDNIEFAVYSGIEKGKLSVRIGHKTIRALGLTQGSQLPTIREDIMCLFTFG